MKTEKIAAALRCSSRVPGPQLDCRTCSYHIEETVDGVDYAGCDCDRIAVDAADRLEELVERCARYAEEIAVLRERMRPYEDTGLPADVCAEYRKFEDEVVASGKTFGRLLELLRADTDGRVAVLPCKVGQRVFALLDTDKHISECEVKRIGLGNEIGFVGLEPIGARGREYGVSLNGFGKTVFLTREAAEKALEAMREEEVTQDE